MHSDFKIMSYNKVLTDGGYIINGKKWNGTCMHFVNIQKDQFCEC